MRRRRLEELFKVEEALSHKLIEVDENGRCECPFHEDGEKYMKHYEELNAVACLNPSCVHYRQVFTSIDILGALDSGTRYDLELLAEDLTIHELERYRASSVLPAPYEEAEEQEVVGVDAKG